MRLKLHLNGSIKSLTFIESIRFGVQVSFTYMGMDHVQTRSEERRVGKEC